MNGINRRGQKVVCIKSLTVFTADGLVFQAWQCPGQIPQIDATYTVDDFPKTGVVLGGEDHGPGIALSEVLTPICECCDRQIGWPIEAFRPLDERKTDISDIIEAGNRTDLLTPADEIKRAFERVTGSPLPEKV